MKLVLFASNSWDTFFSSKEEQEFPIRELCGAMEIQDSAELTVWLSLPKKIKQAATLRGLCVTEFDLSVYLWYHSQYVVLISSY